MQWQKMGLVWSASGQHPWQSRGAGLPTPLDLGDGRLRVFVYSLDSQQIGRTGYVDVASDNPLRVLSVSSSPILDIGPAGAFDDHGVVPVSVVRIDSRTVYLYYVGFELCQQIRYRLFTGLAISEDNGSSFRKLGRTPVLDRTDQELFFRCGSHVRYENGRFRLWYIAGSDWRELQGKQVPLYDLRYLESDDGVHWGPVGTVVMPLDPEREHGFGRPCVVESPDGAYEMFFSARTLNTGAYQLAYARSLDGICWQRCDDQLVLQGEQQQWDLHAQCFPAVITQGRQRYMFYNGNNFGSDGFGLALQQL
jgi:hypothetical protein